MQAERALPRFMRHLDSVREDGANRSHWVAAGPLGVAVEWDAELINEVHEDLRLLQQILEAGEIAQAVAPATKHA